MRATCACCGYRTLAEGRGSYEVCAVCWWEDDPTQLASPLLRGGANVVSLNEAQLYFLSAGVSDPRFRRYVRPPTEDEVADPHWRPWTTRQDIRGEQDTDAAFACFIGVNDEPGAPYWLRS